VRLLLAHLGVEYEKVEVSVVDRSNRAELLGDLNPGLRVPTLVLDDGRPLAESNAILWYFGDETPYGPEDPYARARAGAPVAVLRAELTTRNNTRLSI
jgi:glutathione S-transferase